MSSQLPSSFASAAAGQSNRDPRSSRDGRGSGSGDWARRDGRPSNGTMTFRRSSTTPFNNQSTTLPTQSSEGPAVQAHPLIADPVPYDGPARYSRVQMLEIFKTIDHGSVPDIESLFVPGWNPAPVNGNAARNWGKGNENHVPQDPSVCWEADGSVKPIGLQEMTVEERELFASDVNSPIKPPQQNKDSTQQGGVVNGRKPSVSHGTNNFVTTPSTASRPSTRRQPTDNSPFPVDGLVSPTGNGRFARTDSSSWFNGRRGLEDKDDVYEEPPEDSGNNREPPSARSVGFGSLSRAASGTTPGINTLAASSALWGAPAGPASASVSSPMGSFGNFSMPASATADKRFAGTSRLAHLIPKDSNATGEGSPARDTSAADAGRSWRPRPRTDTDPFSEEAGSLNALREGTSPSPKQTGTQRAATFETPSKSAGDYGISSLSLGTRKEENASPETNPYRSPPAERGEEEPVGTDYGMSHAHGQSADQAPSFGSIIRGFPATNAIEGSDRSQTSSVGANKGFSSINPLSGWPSRLATGTPDRDRSAYANPFGNSIFSPDVQSPSALGGLGGVFGPSSASGSLRGSSKLGGLFPAAMQAQMQAPDHDHLVDSVPDFRQANPLGAIGRSATGPQPRDTESPMRGGRSGVFEELFPSDQSRTQGLLTTAELTSGLTSTTSQPFGNMSAPHPFSTSHLSGDTAQSQARQMVMPDRMRWVYLDPQGTHQGPFTGLEMNDWYKANFFTPDLRVKKVEDDDFEPLGQLIRRIGNSREPFLVPQIGVAHGPPSQAGPFVAGDNRGVIPPLMGAFPSFGRTLTAEEQNNLERRKQEEQFLMHRQREFMAQQHQQAFSRMGVQAGVPSALHHHSSAHSLQSQPSFGSITSPLVLPPQQTLSNLAAGTASYFETSQGPFQPSLVSTPADIFSHNLSSQERQLLANMQTGSGLHSDLLPAQRPIGAGSSGPSLGATETNLLSQLPSVDQLQQDAFSDRLKEFHQLRAKRQEEESADAVPKQNVNSEMLEEASPEPEVQPEPAQVDEDILKVQEITKKANAQASSLSLTQQVQKTQAQAAAASKQVQPQESESLMPFPPPAGAPIAAPTAQRNRSTLPDQFAISRSQSGTPESLSQAAPPPLAPWARAEPESQKGPNFKEIQEAEAKKAARAELAAATARRAQLEQEAALAREREKTAVTGAAPILPTSSTWGNGSPVTPSASSPWAKPVASTPIEAPTGNGTKKQTLAQIQREEEARKQRMARAQEQAAAATASAAINSMGKRYADLASKVNAQGVPATVTAPPPGWSTVGAGGKVKIPTGPAAQQGRTVSAGNVKLAAAAPVAAAVLKPAPAPARSVTATVVSAKDNASVAMDEFNKWLRRELARGISGGIDIDTFASTLLVLPLDQTLIMDAVYGSSTTMDGRHFAEEFVRRKKLADRGVVEKQPTGGLRSGVSPGAASGSSGDNKGWSEVAKKGGNTANGASATATTGLGADGGIQGAGFKVVPGRKRGKK